MYKVIKRDCPMFGIGPYVCEFICDTASDITTLPTSISEGTGGRTAYDNQKCASGSIAIIAENGSESKQYMLNNHDIWCPYSIAVGNSGGGSSESPITIDFALSETSENPVANKVIVTALNEKANIDDLPDLSAYALKSKYGDTTIDVGRKAGSDVGEYSTAEGKDSVAIGYASHAEGSNTKTTRDGSTSTLVDRDVAIDEKTTVVVSSTQAYGRNSHAEGCQSLSYGENSHAEATSDAIGWGTHAEGGLTRAEGEYSHAEGLRTKSVGSNSHAEGENTLASGRNSHAGGDGTKALHNNEFACGRYNLSNSDTVFSVGDGISDTDRHNAFEITTTGGKIHDKDIATTDLIPDLSAYAKTADVPNIKVNAAVNADKIEGFPAQKLFCQRDNLASKDLNDCVELGSYFFNGINANAPTSNETINAGAYAVVDNIIYNKDFIKQTCQFIHGGSAYLGRMFVRYYDIMLACWSEWKEIYTEASKPYITGSVTVAANSDVCVTNHGFTPSAVIWWDGSSSGVAVSFSSTQFTMSLMSTSDRTVKYLIFK